MLGCGTTHGKPTLECFHSRIERNLMSLVTGTRLGPYEVIAALGMGGMGEVYRAHDKRLQRQVAIKILRDNFSTDAEQIQRFEREAHVLASLNHPNIATIYGIEGSAIVMELVEGETLADRIAKGRLPVNEALRIAAQIAEALEAAHGKDIIHRDLKPANVKLTQDGKVKLLDFGLARFLAPRAGADARESTVETATLTATAPGALLGTAPYMSPEQVRGLSVDRRADIWAFGCVLYELLTAKRAFRGANATETFAAIVSSDPDWSILPTATPEAATRVLHRCLQKDPDRRLHDIADARLEIEDALALPFQQPVKTAGGSGFRAWPWAIAALATAMSVVGGYRYIFEISRYRVERTVHRLCRLTGGLCGLAMAQRYRRMESSSHFRQPTVSASRRFGSGPLIRTRCSRSSRLTGDGIPSGLPTADQLASSPMTP